MIQAAAVSQADSPAPGPGDAIAIAIAVFAAGEFASSLTNEKDSEASGYVNMDTNALVAVIEKPTTPEGVSAAAAIEGKHPIVSQQAQKEFLAPPLGTGKGDAAAFSKFLVERGGVMRPHPTQATVDSLTGRGLSEADAKVVGAGAEAGVSTLTRDREIIRRVPELVVTF